MSTEQPETAPVVTNGQNAEQVHEVSPQTSSQTNEKPLHCARCDSLILLAGKGTVATPHPFNLPRVTQKKSDLKDASITIETDPLIDFICVADMFDFENVGFTNSVQNVKYLTCADCEIGPIGYQCPATKKCYLSVDRCRVAA